MNEKLAQAFREGFKKEAQEDINSSAIGAIIGAPAGAAFDQLVRRTTDEIPARGRLGKALDIGQAIAAPAAGAAIGSQIGKSNE